MSKVVTLCCTLLLLCSSVLQAEEPGWALFERVQQSVKQYNFDSSFVVFKGSQVETYRWQHGRKDDREIEHLVPLDADGVDILRRDDVVYYFLTDRPALVTISDSIKELPAILFQNSQQIRKLYTAVLGSSSVMSGHTAQLLRLSANDASRHSYWLWIEVESGFPLRIDVMSEQQTPLERWLVTHMQISPELPENLQRLLDTDLPEPAPQQAGAMLPPNKLQLSWLPKGYQLVTDPHIVPQLQQSLLNYWLLTDGVHQVSVFVQPSQRMQTQAYRDGATTIYVLSAPEHDITVIGPVSIEVAERLAAAVR
ncbi:MULTISPECIES: MucB/RseB C-terminal domain-containing protein [unclassified Arsukibacterium]|uniref:MucB/RseB C-terminal domain-containing protein n=1 Tax=unclassified Arsukibacterium TaxID=2635278 RepID=UPI000C65C440|nr:MULTISPECIES: MucB/RseB C-terminal domain-containing protein [unclassified Arsukibacterium]MAA95452.1 anti-sigma 24 factor [Rheinheimera sp.]MBM33544.1 anti-sigma 24 factor [Rheinheimera sp.]HAW92874.1 anti-sigma 24 factor [Candidatus Azambacteria bacterium]|tara:strand:+ start:245395 stop:246324 length:930 start_codon:yes stop_codon:yes gene_type:complete